MINKNYYWGSLDELHQTADDQESVGKEFPSPPQEQEVTEMERREFLKLMGAGFLLSAAVSCARPVEKIIPYVNKPEEITPGIANWYTSTCMECSAVCGLIVKTREGRPIKVEGNRDHPLSKGGLCARGQAGILNLYDPDRLKGPGRVNQGEMQEASWTDLDREIGQKLAQIAGSGGRVVLLTGALTSPTTKKLIDEFLHRFPNSRHVSFEAVVPEEIARGQELSYGQKIVPHYDFSKADFILSLGADFLGTWLSPVEFAKDFSRGRRAEKGKMSRLVCVESLLSLTGTNADSYLSVRAGDETKVALSLAHEILVVEQKSSWTENKEITSFLSPYSIEKVSQETGLEARKLKDLAHDLWQHRGKGVVLGGAIKGKNALSLQIAVNLLNSILDNEGKTVVATPSSNQAQSSYADLLHLHADLKNGNVSALLIYKTNPVYSLPADFDFSNLIQKVPLVVSFSDRLDETASLSHYACPANNPFESWDDANPVTGLFTLVQPTIQPLHNTRSFQDTLLAWKGDMRGWFNYLKNNWQATIYKGTQLFEAFWEETLQTGFYQQETIPSTARSFQPSSLQHISRVNGIKELLLTLYPSVAHYDGRSANNAWLMELPDPITKVTWDNYLSIAPQKAEEMNLKEGEVVSISTENYSLELPVLIQPRLHENSVTAAVGFGRLNVGSVGNKVGRNTYPFQSIKDGFLEWGGLPVQSLQKTGKHYRLAVTQGHHRIEGRPIIQETTFDEFQKNPESGAWHAQTLPTFWPRHEYKGYRWGMAIDLSACIGCNGCMVGCQSENNVPVVGKEQVLIGRDMHWLRIDRYYSGPEDNPEITYQPMLCQHCENAPCETVCPVIATVHNDEGLNEQIYNRCVGTRYCSNNCPYKVRRFNYYDFWRDEAYPLHVREPIDQLLNPDLTVRSRGVMEKCTFCMQRIRQAKDQAKDEGRSVKDGEILTACQQSCPTDAIVFGDLNDPESLVSKLKKSPRGYHVIEDLNTQPQVTYLRKVRNA